jgi:hypothetical protein
MTWKDFLQIRLSESWGIEISLGPALIAVLIVVGGIAWLYFRKSTKHFELVELEVRLGNLGRVKIRPSYEDVQVAHKAWTELVTRKAAITFEENHDVIVEVYDSWYELFGRMRNLVKEIPARKIRLSDDTRELVRVLVEALNRGLRPHLTKWQAKFRKWYQTELEKKSQETPQEIQRRYPEYSQLVAELKTVNEQIVEYADLLKRVSQGK